MQILIKLFAGFLSPSAEAEAESSRSPESVGTFFILSLGLCFGST